MFDAVFSAGDFTGDGKADVIGRTPIGALFLYRGNGAGGFTGGGAQIGTGWGIYRTVFSGGDLNRDGHVDIVGIKGDGSFQRVCRGQQRPLHAARSPGWDGLTFPAVFAVT